MKSQLQIALEGEGAIVEAISSDMAQRIAADPNLADARRELRLAIIKAVVQFQLQVARVELWTHEDQERRAA